MYSCTVESLREWNYLIRVFDKNNHLIGMGSFFGNDQESLHLFLKIESSEAQNELLHSVSVACQQKGLEAEWFLVQPDNS